MGGAGGSEATGVPQEGVSAADGLNPYNAQIQTKIVTIDDLSLCRDQILVKIVARRWKRVDYMKTSRIYGVWYW